VKDEKGETLCQSHLADQQLHQLLEKVDADLAQETAQAGCLYCNGKLHRADYDRKPRGGPQWDRRYSFCCAQEDCRRRRTPESVRFLGRRVYVGLVVVLITAMVHGLKPARVRRIREALQIDSRTVKRWRQWWLDKFVRSSFTESGPGPIHASGMRTDTAVVIVVEFWAWGTRPPGGCLRVSKADNHLRGLEGACYVRVIPTPAEDAGWHKSGSGARSQTSLQGRAKK
jgi:hypothetical protein